MIKKIVNVLKKVVVAFVILYGFNLLVSSINIFVTINLVTVGIVSILGLPGLLSLIIMYFLV